MAVKLGELYPRGNRSEGIKFQFNPERRVIRRQPQYAEVGAAEADYWQDYKGPSPLQWVRNPPLSVSFELLFIADGDEDVEEPVNKIKKMMGSSGNNPRGKTPGPPDLVYEFGQRAAVVRIMSAEFDEEMWTSDLRLQRVRVRLELKTVKNASR